MMGEKGSASASSAFNQLLSEFAAPVGVSCKLGVEHGESTGVTNSINELRHAMDALCESIRLSWEEIATRPLNAGDVWEITRFINATQDDLASLRRRVGRKPESRA